MSSHPHIAVQVGPQSVFDEGPEHLLDLLQSSCHTTSVHVYPVTHHRYAPWARNIEAKPQLADHGCPMPDIDRSTMTDVWFRADPRYYDHAGLVPRPYQPGMTYGDRDVFDELAEPAARRGMEIHARICDWGPYVPSLIGSQRWCAMNLDGVRKPYYCHNHPEYRRWWESLFEDLFRNKPYLAGLNFGHERGAPLGGAMAGSDADCFCEHCCAMAERRGINIDKAKQGFLAIKQWSLACRSGQKPVNGNFVTFFGLLREFPEVLAWDKLWTDGQGELDAGIYHTIKAIKPEAQVGWHIFQHMSFSPIFRAQFRYEDMAPYADYIKPVIYHDCAGKRFQSWTLQHYGEHLFGDMDHGTLVAMLYGMLGYNAAREPSSEQLLSGQSPGFSAEYCAREVRRAAASGKPVWAGIGFDVPDGKDVEAGPDTVTAVTKAVFEAGAAGLVISREYHEMQIPHLEAVGKALRDLNLVTTTKESTCTTM